MSIFSSYQGIFRDFKQEGVITVAEFCFDCLKKQQDYPPMSKKDFVISKDWDLCEDCCEMKPVVVRYKLKRIIAERLRKYFQ